MKTQSALINPVKLPDNLNEAERHFVQCMATGMPCMFSTTRPKPDDKNAPVIRAGVIGFFVWGGNEENPILGNRIYLQGAQVREVLDLEYCLSPYMLVMAYCHLNNEVKMAHAGVRYLSFAGSRLANGLAGTGVQITSDLVMDDGFSSDRAVVLLDANIGGGMFCNGGTFTKTTFNTKTKEVEISALAADRIKVGANVVLTDGFLAKGGARFLGAEIGGYFTCNGGKFFKNEEGVSLAADEIKIESHLMTGKGFCADGTVLFPGADIRGEAYCDEGEFGGAVHFDGANIGRDLLFRGSQFKNDEGESLIFDTAKVGGNVSMSDGFSAAGVVSFVSADIGRALFCNGGTFNDGLVAQGAKIKDALIFNKVKGSGTVNLSFASVDVLIDDKESRNNFAFNLTGFSYSHFYKPADAKSRIGWLTRRPDGMPFSPQPFEQAAKVLFATGHNHDAREVLLAKDRLLTKHGKLPLWHKYFWRPLWHAFAGYGYRLLWTLVWSVMFIAVGRALFDFADYSCRIAPHQPVAVLNKKYEPMRPGEGCTDARRPTNVMAREYPDYPRFDALAFSLDVFIPVFALHQESHWYPQQQKGDTNFFLRWLRLWYWIQIGAGWILTSLLVLTITGLLRPRQSSGDKE